MKVGISFFLLIFLTIRTVHACHLKQSLVSLSGPVTMILEELKLLSDPKLLGVSKFHPVKNQEVKKLAGGIFLSRKTLDDFGESIIFFDKSKELSDTLTKYTSHPFEVDTRSIDPFTATRLSLKKIKPFIQGCQERLVALESRLSKIERELKLPETFRHSVFYLGKMGEKKPDLIIGNDGFVISLKKLAYFKTYPGNLSYLPWSKKILNKLKEFKHIGINDSKSDQLIIKKISNDKYNFYLRGIFIPGITQVNFLQQLSSNF